MGLPFNSGYELAKFFGYGELYAAAVKKDEENKDMVESVKGLMGKIHSIDIRNIRQTLD